MPERLGSKLAVGSSLLDLVGNTPLVELRNITPKAGVKIYAKLEGQNPSGSIKDRVAKAMIEAAEAAGQLAPGREYDTFTAVCRVARSRNGALGASGVLLFDGHRF